MKLKIQVLMAVLVGAGVFALGASPARCADEFCPMGGTAVKVEVDKEKALEWGRDRRNAVITAEDADDWSVLARCKSDGDIAIRVDAGGVFFGVAGRGGQELDARDINKAYGKDLDDLKEAVKKEMGELGKADVVKLGSGDVQDLADAAGLGTLEKDRAWALTTQDCTGTDLDASGLK